MTLSSIQEYTEAVQLRRQLNAAEEIWNLCKISSTVESY